MSAHRKLALLAGFVLAATVDVSHAETVPVEGVTTDPVGYQTYTVAGNSSRALGFPLMREAVFRGRVSAGDAASITLDADVDFAGLLTSDTAYFVEVVTHPDEEVSVNIGERFDINTAATITAANNTVVINAESVHNTAAGPFDGLVNYSVVIRPHWTIAELFGTGVEAEHLNSGTSLSQADQIWVWTGNGVSTFWFRQNSAGDVRGWRNTATGTENRDSEIIAPGSGVIFKRTGTDEMEMITCGFVRTNRMLINKPYEVTLVSTGYPIDLSPSDQNFDSDSNFVSATTVSNADQIWTWNEGKVSTFWYRENSTGEIKSWRNTATGISDRTSDDFMLGEEAFFLKTSNEASAITTPRPY